MTEDQRDMLQKLFCNFQPIFLQDFHDYRVNNLNTVCIATGQKAEPTFVCYNKIPLAANKSIQEILDELLKKKIIKECNSTYNQSAWC